VKPAYGVIVPLRNEAAILPVTVPLLLEATTGDDVRIIWVCNGCSDDSAAVIRRLAGSYAEVVELARPGKTAALQAGDEQLGPMLPRLYLDADTWLNPGDPARLVEHLLSGAADLVAPRLQFDTSKASALSVRIGACWMSLPYARTAAFSAAIGVSSAGRALWDRWPEITGDDIFVSAKVPKHRKLIVPEACATTAMPSDFAGWVRTRARWLKGEAELSELGLSLPNPGQQRLSLIRQMVSRETALGAWAFAAARILAAVARTDAGRSTWLPERSATRNHL
jgi:hypothetical protein